MGTSVDPQNRIVHYVLSNGQCRPYMVVRAWSDTMVNGILFLDGSNDNRDVPHGTNGGELTVWKTSISRSDTLGTSNTWHWPEAHNNG